MAVIEDLNSDWYHYYNQQYKLGPTAPVLKLLAQQSGCFVVVERSNRAMKGMMRERGLEESGELRESSNFGKGQMVSADYSMSPTITFSNKDAGGVGARIGGWLPPAARSYVGAGAGVKAQDASTLLTLIDNRSSVQLAAAEGSARNLDFSAVSSIFTSNPFGTGGSGSSSFGGYTKTAEGKVIVAALTDAFNNMVKALREYKAQHVEGGLGTGRGALQVQPQ
jgi:curli biogenesis system outer membrane secretion channel CsgG